MRLLLMVLVTIAAGLPPALARAQPTPQPATAPPPARGPVVVRKTDVIYGRVQGSPMACELSAR